MTRNIHSLSKVLYGLLRGFSRSTHLPPKAGVSPGGSHSPENVTQGTALLKNEMNALLEAMTSILDSTDPVTIPSADMTAIESLADQLYVSTNDLCRKVRAVHTPPPSRARSFDGKEEIGIHVMRERPPWRGLASRVAKTPGMITAEEASYYAWVARFYTGRGRVVELGPWLGSSTIAIHSGLRSNPHFANEKLQVFDDFIWRKSWMDPYVADAEKLPNHASFRHLFDRYTNKITGDLAVHQSRFAVYDGNDAVNPLQWSLGEIEMIFVDCGRTIDANEGWYRVLSPFFIPGVTIVVMQDWRLHRELPRKWFNQTALFTESKGPQLQLMHEVQDGGIATFLYSGAAQ